MESIAELLRALDQHPIGAALTINDATGKQVAVLVKVADQGYRSWDQVIPTMRTRKPRPQGKLSKRQRDAAKRERLRPMAPVSQA